MACCHIWSLIFHHPHLCMMLSQEMMMMMMMVVALEAWNALLCWKGSSAGHTVLYKLMPKLRQHREQDHSFVTLPPPSIEDLLGKGRLWSFLPTPCPRSLAGYVYASEWRNGYNVHLPNGIAYIMTAVKVPQHGCYPVLAVLWKEKDGISES